MVSTYDIDSKRHELLLKDAREGLTKEDFKEAFIEASLTAAAYKKKHECLVDSVFENLDEKDAKFVCDDADERAEAFDYRALSDEQMAKLDEYGYTDPIYPIDNYEEAMEYAEAGYPVVLLNRDNTFDFPKIGIDIERHLKEGGLVGVDMFAVEDKEIKWLEEGLDDDIDNSKKD